MSFKEVGSLERLGNHATDPATGDATGFGAFTTADAATDPTAVTLKVKKPDETTLTYGWPSAGANGTLTRESAGRFYYDVTLDQDGLWEFRLSGTGAAQAAVQARFRVARLRVE